MPETITKFRIFIASPSGLDIEREAFRDTVVEHNEIELQGRGLVFTPVGWEITLGGVGRPQALINHELITCDYFILVLWDRWGTPTDTSGEKEFSSGCEEEFNVALHCLADPTRPMRQVLVLFKDVDPKRLADAGPQLARVLQFKNELIESKKHLFMSFGTAASFEKLLRKFLAQWALDHEHSPPEHARLLERGTDYWNSWRTNNPDVSPNLFRANLRGAYLSGVNLSGANLARSDLSYADLVDADLSGATLSEAVLLRTNLFGANLEKTDLTGAMFAKAHMRNSNICGARLGETVIAETDLTDVNGLDSIEHSAPSSIDHLTIMKSGDSLPLIFLRSAGLPDTYLEYIPALLNQPIEFYSCFISYSTKDQSFADRLFSDLQTRGVRCWFAPQNITGGRKIAPQIDDAIRFYERLLLVLSDNSLNSEWVKTEIAAARRRELTDRRQILFPVSLVSFDKIASWQSYDADTGRDSAREVREYYIPDFSKWKDHDSYKIAFERLLRDLKKR